MKEFLETEKAHENTPQSESVEIRLAVILDVSDDCVSCVLRDMPL